MQYYTNRNSHKAKSDLTLWLKNNKLVSFHFDKRLFQLAVVLWLPAVHHFVVNPGEDERFFERISERDGDHHCDDGVCARGERLGADCNQRGFVRNLEEEHRFDVAVSEVEHQVGELSGCRGPNIELEVSAIVSLDIGELAADVAEHEFREEGKPRARDVHRIGEVKEHRAKARRQPAPQAAEEQTGEQAEDISEMDSRVVDAGRDRNREL